MSGRLYNILQVTIAQVLKPPFLLVLMVVDDIIEVCEGVVRKFHADLKLRAVYASVAVNFLKISLINNAPDYREVAQS